MRKRDQATLGTKGDIRNSDNPLVQDLLKVVPIAGAAKGRKLSNAQGGPNPKSQPQADALVKLNTLRNGKRQPNDIQESITKPVLYNSNEEKELDDFGYFISSVEEEDQPILNIKNIASDDRPTLDEYMKSDQRKLEDAARELSSYASSVEEMHSFFSGPLMSLEEPVLHGMRMEDGEMDAFVDEYYEHYYGIKHVPIETAMGWGFRFRDESKDEIKAKNPLGRTGIKGLGNLTKLGANNANHLLLTFFHKEEGPQILVFRDPGREWKFVSCFDGDVDELVRQHNKHHRFFGTPLFDFRSIFKTAQNTDPVAERPVVSEFNTDDAWVHARFFHTHIHERFIPHFFNTEGKTEFRWIPISSFVEEAKEMNPSHAKFLRENTYDLIRLCYQAGVKKNQEKMQQSKY